MKGLALEVRYCYMEKLRDFRICALC